MGDLSQLYGPLSTMSKKVAKLQSSFVGAERIFSLLDVAPDVRERPRACATSERGRRARPWPCVRIATRWASRFGSCGLQPLRGLGRGAASRCYCVARGGASFIRLMMMVSLYSGPVGVSGPAPHTWFGGWYPHGPPSVKLAK